MRIAPVVRRSWHALIALLLSVVVSVGAVTMAECGSPSSNGTPPSNGSGRSSHAITDLDHKKLVTHPEVDVVHIASPNRFHCEMALAALRAGDSEAARTHLREAIALALVKK